MKKRKGFLNLDLHPPRWINILLNFFSAEIGKPFNASSNEDVGKLIQCAQAALPFFSVSFRIFLWKTVFIEQMGFWMVGNKVLKIYPTMLMYLYVLNTVMQYWWCTFIVLFCSSYSAIIFCTKQFCSSRLKTSDYPINEMTLWGVPKKAVMAAWHHGFVGDLKSWDVSNAKVHYLSRYVRSQCSWPIY